MNTTNKIQPLKIFKYFLLHSIELLILLVLSWVVLTYAPEKYQWPVFILFIVLYILYLGNSLVEDYREYKGGDFMV